jgi:regulation of enolase protein 1 (concanavalin A-like superfamily)
MRPRTVERIGVCLVALACITALPARAFAQTLPSPWLTRDIGSPSPAGSATYSNQQFLMTGSGADIWGTSDQFRFAYQAITGDVEIVARIGSFTAVDPWSKVGVMIRNDLTSSAAHAFSLLSGANGIAFQRRLQAGGSSYHTAGPLVSAPRWVRLRRIGSTLTASTGTDGGSWTTVGSSTVAMNATVYVGLAITSHNPGSLASAVLSNVSVTPLGGLPAGQSSRDIGSPAIAGSTSYSSGVYTVKAAGVDIWGSADQFRFVYQQITGDVDVVARVSSLTNINVWSKAGVMIRESLDANSRHAMALMSAGRGYSFQWRLDTGGLAAYSSGGSGIAPAWVRLKRTGYQIQAYRSTDGGSWTSIGVQTIPMADTVYVGLAVTSHDATALTSAVIDQLKITATSATTNQPPAVTLTSPANGASFTAPASVSIAASASDPEGRLSKVEFYVGSTLVAADTTSPFTTSWSTSTPGSYAIKAVAYDADGGVTTSATSGITVTSSTSPLPTTVVFQASADHDTLVTSYRLDIFANGANPGSATPLASSNLGKPTPASNGEITVDRTSFFTALAPGTYVATVSAIGSGGESRSAAINFVR